MGPSRSKIKKTRKSIMKPTKGESRYYTYIAVLGICIACLPWLVAASQIDEDGDLEAAESQNIGATQQQRPQTVQQRPQAVQQHPQQQAAPSAVPTSPIPVAVPPPPGLQSSVGAPPAGFTMPKTDLASAPSYAPRYAVPPENPWRDRFPFPTEVQQFRRRATDDDGNQPDDDYQPQESKGKKHSPSVFKRIRNGIRNTGKAIVGAPSYIIKRYRGTWKKYVGGGGGGKKKKGGWKAWSSSTSDKNDGWGWEESEPSGGGYYDEASHYPSDKGWKSEKGYSKGYDSHERRYDRDRESTSYRDYRDRNSNNKDYDKYDSPPPSRPARYRAERGDRPKYNSSYREETHYDDYDGRRTTAYYGSSTKKTPPRRPSSGSGNYRYDDDY